MDSVKKTERMTLRLEDALRDFIKDKAAKRHCKEAQIVRDLIRDARERESRAAACAA